MNTSSPEHNTTTMVGDKQQNVKNGQYAIGLETTSSRGTKAQLLGPTLQKRKSINNKGPSRRSTSRSSGRPPNALLARRKVIRLLIAVIVSFATCVLPYHIRVLWQTWSEPHLSFWTSLLTPITFVLFYLNSGLNPILYAFLSDNFRRSLRELLLCGRDGRLRRGMSTMSSTSMRTASTSYVTHNPWLFTSRANCPCQHVKTRMLFSRKPTSRLPTEGQTLTIWSWDDLDLGMTLTSFKTLTSEKSN